MKAFGHNIFTALALLSALLLAVSCELHKSESQSGTGTVVVKITNPVEIQTKHASGEGSDASDGGIMKTLGVWLITDGAANGKYTILQRNLSTPNAATHTVEFKDVARGNYFLVAAANYDQTTMNVGSYTDGTTVPTEFTASLVTTLINGSTVSTLTDGQSPTFDDTHGMPSSFEKTFSVAAGENVIEAHLRRCVGRLTFNVRNNLDDYELFVHHMGLSKYNKSQGYVFESKDNSSVDNVEFPDLPDMGQDGDGVKDGLVQVSPRAYKNIYDIYLFETNPGLEFTFDMLAALYPKGTTASDDMIGTETYTVTSYDIKDNAYDYSTSKQYLIRSVASSTYYLGDDGSGNLVATSFTDDTELKNNADLKNYLWTFSSAPSSSSQGRGQWGGNKSTSDIKNFGTEKYINLSTTTASLSASSNKYSNRKSDSGLTFYTRGEDGKTYYLALSSNSPVGSTSTYYWQVREVEEVSAESTRPVFLNYSAQIPRTTRTIKYIDSYGASQPLTKIDRNEHVTVNINVFYNRELGQFDFEVLDWDDGGEHETTFD